MDKIDNIKINKTRIEQDINSITLRDTYIYINGIKIVTKEDWNKVMKKQDDIINKAIKYIENDIFDGKEDIKWCKKNDLDISGTDMPSSIIIKLLDILEGKENG